ncbi:MAG TPA: hypothetical protein VK816_11480 [Jatrophihabitantaceae bacterium]|jgi:hypothetical protein|nr:hypothetical protein [Jatrophihabitantaceae bacterium]
MPAETRAHRAPGPTPHERYTVTIAGAAMYDGYLCLQYGVCPVPAQLAPPPGDRRPRELHQGGDAGIAMDSWRHVYRDCESGYHVSRDGQRVVGALKIGPARWPGTARVTVLFHPFAHTRGLERTLCEVLLILDGDQVRRKSIRPLWPIGSAEHRSY